MRTIPAALLGVGTACILLVSRQDTGQSRALRPELRLRPEHIVPDARSGLRLRQQIPHYQRLTVVGPSHLSGRRNAGDGRPHPQCWAGRRSGVQRDRTGNDSARRRRAVSRGGSRTAPQQQNAELFSPPYLSKGPQPPTSSVPSSVRYGTSFRVLTPQAATITRASLIRLGSVTHAFDMNQRFQRLSFTRQSDGTTLRSICVMPSPHRIPVEAWL
jgi:hypothetical protein